jgi:murein L,D-transpeptidase YcbB/YkuD
MWGTVCLAAALGGAAGAALAEQSWIQFGPVGAGSSYDSYDREFIKEWEGNPPPGYPTLSPANVAATKAAVKRYTEIVAEGGWANVPDDVELKAGHSSASVALLRHRLFMSGDLQEEGSLSEFFDGYLDKALKRFQASNGLTPTGVLDKRTAAALNVPAEMRLRQLKTNASRLAGLVKPAGKKYVVVNIPAAQIEAVEGNQVVSRHTGVVGKPERPTPLLQTTIHEMNFNPVWRLPPTVVEKDLIPKGREMQQAGKNVLVKYGIDAYDGGGKKLDPEKINWSSGMPHGLSYSQQPGKENPLGFLKINFHNSYSVYMHDTPSESLFGKNFRAASSGCIRVRNIDQLAAWLLAGQDGWGATRIQEIKESGKRLDVRIKKPVPLYFVYLTAWATEDRVVQFRRDIYNRDGAGPQVSAY